MSQHSSTLPSSVPASSGCVRSSTLGAGQCGEVHTCKSMDAPVTPTNRRPHGLACCSHETWLLLPRHPCPCVACAAMRSHVSGVTPVALAIRLEATACIQHTGRHTLHLVPWMMAERPLGWPKPMPCCLTWPLVTTFSQTQ